jgi:hypothetical protein
MRQRGKRHGEGSGATRRKLRWRRARIRPSYGPLWAHYLSGFQDRLLGGPLGLLGLGCTTPVGVGRKDLGGEVLG